MARSKTVTHSGYLLHSRPFRETSLLLDLFTSDQGRLSAVFKGGRKGAKARARPEPFVHYHLGLFGSGELKSVSSFEIDARYTRPRLSGVRLFGALYVNELLYKLMLPHAAHAEIYQAYEDVLLALHATGNYEAHLRNFELKLLAELGYGISFVLEADGHTPVDQSLFYEFVPGVGFQRRTAVDSDDSKVVQGQILTQVAEGHWHNEQVLALLKSVNQQALNLLLKGKPINTREFLRKTRR